MNVDLSLSAWSLSTPSPHLSIFLRQCSYKNDSRTQYTLCQYICSIPSFNRFTEFCSISLEVNLKVNVCTLCAILRRFHPIKDCFYRTSFPANLLLMAKSEGACNR